jgi:hypothetical protein
MVTGSAPNGSLNDCAANYKPVLSSERVPYIKKKIVKHKKIKI